MRRRPRPPRVPVERDRTPRQAIRRHLGVAPHTAADLAARLGLREREVVEHLEHLRRSLHRGPERLVMEPAACERCGYAFPGRRRLSTPSSCPRCRGSRIAPPVFRIEGPRAGEAV